MADTAQGHTARLVARTQELASPDTCYLTGGTAVLASGYFELEDLDRSKIELPPGRARCAQCRAAGGLL
jgi:hypothetical protein